ncbi:hypothetical protein [Deinococcus cellulosilyticus]|uniref:Uncharacterized protein n=1 Tax=Deinococcus cellulosilyticus (strain DSM 18568 / NBRC 106333 / KACC 11606 / 5516J-15) TaxID=1223518 RepID=A0A511N1G6_DEIC1|nr:hypothetical protein [Deinococcus cellulosilyticus]GEM46725.1 hypothetical protein DC3_23600 [Deinococcus cellulosilyticus NBRC 106333 = KACC 11606]
MFRSTFIRSSVLLLTASSSVALAQSEYIHLLQPTSSFVSAQGVVRFPFTFQSVAPESGRKMYQSQVIQYYFEQLKQAATENGFSRACISRELHHLTGRSKQDLKTKETQWIAAFKKSPTFYTVLDQINIPPFETTEGRVDGTIYVLKVPRLNMTETFGFFNDDDRKNTWVMQCGSGK